MKKFAAALLLIEVLFTAAGEKPASWIRINQLGYLPNGIKVAVWCSKSGSEINSFQLVGTVSGKVVFEGSSIASFGAYGPFDRTARLDFSKFTKPGNYFLRVGNAQSAEFEIGDQVYRGTADFCLRYMRQQRSGFNPYLKDSCHTHDGYTVYGPMPDSTHINVSGGWHDATDYLQYATTSANATYHLLAAYRDFPNAFNDLHLANGLEGKNEVPDVLDEAVWGLSWLSKMHPRPDWMFNQLADDRDHHGMRLPKEDPYYGKGFERPVYFCSGKPQGLGKYKNRATGVASTAGKFSSAFALGYELLKKRGDVLAPKLLDKALSSYDLGLKHPGVCQTACCVSPYFYEEDNWVDDMELAAAALSSVNGSKGGMANGYLESAYRYASQEHITPWMGTDTAKHYQWYPFINVGHYELAKQSHGERRKEVISWYRHGIDTVWQKAKRNAFHHGTPFVWCSNNFVTSFAIQCYWYRQLSGDNQYAALEQSCFDWLFGCNPWGTSFVYGLPFNGDTPTDPHSSFTHLYNYPIDGGLVDGPLYGSIYNRMLGITLSNGDEYSEFQSPLVVYHDDFGDYSTNEPTMDGTASLVYLLGSRESEAR